MLLQYLYAFAVTGGVTLMTRLFLYLIIVLFPNQNTVAEKAKRVAATCSSKAGDKSFFCDKPGFSLPLSLVVYFDTS